MKNINSILCILLVLMSGKVIPQTFNNSIYGIVLDKETKEPLPNVNIFIAGTTWGTASRSDGSFSIASIFPGNHEIVFSMVGYESQSRICRLSDSSKIFFRIEMIPKVYEISDVSIIANRPEQWFDDLKVFKKRFLGYSPYTFECKIVNEYHINFIHLQEKILIAQSDYPIEVNNYTLGYNIKCEIIKFEYNQATKASSYTYRLFFTVLDTNDIDVKEEWEENRIRRYKQSLPFFLRALFEENFRHDGFEISLAFKPGYPRLDILSSSDLIEKDSLTETYKLSFSDYLQVKNHNISIEELQMSWIKLNHPSVTIDRYGYPLGTDVITIYGFWSELGIASFLPRYFGFTK